MNRLKRDRKLEAGLDAYSESVRANGAVVNFFKDRLSHWPVYAAAAGSALALSTSAMADIIHNPGGPPTIASATGNQTHTATNGLGGFGKATIRAFHGSQLLPSVSSGQLELGINGGKVLVNASSNVLRLPFGAPISGSARSGLRLLRSSRFDNTVFVSATTNSPAHTVTRRSVGGTFTGTHYAGFLLPNGDPGWLKIAVSNGGSFGVPDQVEILDWALAINGESITAGETQSPGGGTSAPEPGSLALSLLALGSVAVLELKRRRKAGAGQTTGSTQ
jgi:hypothetical protein